MGRLRTNIDAPELIKQYPNYCDLESFKLPNKPIYLEIGSGKGAFLIENAIKHPDILFLGIEKYSTVILKALKKIKRTENNIKNLYFTCADAKALNSEIFKNKISKIYLNFSDPWPKKRHAKRRLTSPDFLKLYKELLIHNGIVEFKTDNDALFRYSLDILNNFKGIKITYLTENLYEDLNNVHNTDNVQTEYEQKFLKLNKKIYKIIWFYMH